jgi:hypothetical protein
MQNGRYVRLVAGTTGVVLALMCTVVRADEATGKVVWVDTRNAALLLECVADGCKQIPSAAKGETFTFAIPERLMAGVGALKEGQQITVAYEKTAQGSYALVELKP